MKFSEKKLLISATLSVSFIFLIAFLFIVSIYTLLISTTLKVFLFLSVFVISVAFICIIVYYLLAPIFKANKLLELLLKDTLHELNIPLSVIKANLHILRLDEKNSKVLKRLNRIDGACVDLNRLYCDVDYYIKREVRYDLKEEFDVKEVVDSEVEKLNSIGLHVKIKSVVPSLHVMADKHGFIKVLNNIINNAIKYNKNDNDVNISLKDGRLSIEDSGIGMSEEEVFKIFDRYYQGDSKNYGFGIGLSIVKAYCDEERIFINILSKKMVGTEILLDFKNILLK